MKFKFSDYIKFLEYLPFIDRFAGAIHDATDADSTKDKAADVIEDVIQIAIDATALTNPALSTELTASYALLKPVLDGLKDKAA